MTSNRDIGNRQDIELLITRFYDRVKTDEVIGFIFTDVVKMDWNHHIPVIVDFWETILLDHPVYTRNAMEVHYNLHRLQPLEERHFTAWLKLFNTTIDELFDGKIAGLAKKRAASIAALMQHKMKSARSGNTPKINTNDRE